MRTSVDVATTPTYRRKQDRRYLTNIGIAEELISLHTILLEAHRSTMGKTYLEGGYHKKRRHPSCPARPLQDSLWQGLPDVQD